MTISDLVFVGIRGTVIALERSSGIQIWATHLKGSDFVNVVLDRNEILATCYGEIFCLDAFSGEPRWHNKLKGFGFGIATIATEHQAPGNALALAAEKARDDQRRRSSAAAAG